MANARSLHRTFKPRFELPENSVLGLYKTETKTTAARGRGTYIRGTENPELGIFRLENKRIANTSRKKVMTFLFFWGGVGVGGGVVVVEGVLCCCCMLKVLAYKIR